jgi:hypothetical protein
MYRHGAQQPQDAVVRNADLWGLLRLGRENLLAIEPAD